MLIGINGFKGVGKDTAGAYLVEKYGFERLSFAAKLKESASALFGFSGPEIWDELKNEDGSIVFFSEHGNAFHAIGFREFLQRYGTEAHRDIFGQDFWVDYALKGIDPNKDYVFTDARFENELRRIRLLGGYNIKIERFNTTPTDDHPSEVEAPYGLIDVIVPNNGSYYDLYNSLDDAIKFLNEEDEYSDEYTSEYEYERS